MPVRVMNGLERSDFDDTLWYPSLVAFPLASSLETPGRNVSFPMEASDVEAGEDRPQPNVFCEMQELMFHGGRQNYEWRETTRWMFFEECVEKPGDRWSKPHVPSLPAVSVFEFRNCLTAGTIVLNLDASSFEELADMVGDILIATNQLSQAAKPEFLSILHLRHLHHFEYKHSLGASLKRLCKTTRVNLVSGQTGKEYGEGGQHVHVDINDDIELDGTVGSNPDRVHKVNRQYRRYVPQNALAASILVGEVAALRSQLTIFVRLARPLYVGDLTEVDAPLKFLCVLLGPAQCGVAWNESRTSSVATESLPLSTMGRVFGALLSNPAFSRVALKAENREGLMSAFDAVVDRSTLLPAEMWDPDVRLAPIAFPAASRHSSAKMASNRQTMRILPTAEGSLDSSFTRSGQLFGGLVNDIKRKLPFFTTDFTECLHLECAVASGIMLLTTLTWLLVFSAVYESMTDRQMGAAETLFGACLSGLIFYTTAGQPLTVIGTTASLFALEWSVVTFCQAYGLDYIGFHFWVIFWTIVVIFVVIMFELSALVCHLTRFSQEIFSVFVASLLMVEAVASLVRILNEYPLNNDRCVCSRDPDLFTDDSTCRVRSIETCQNLVGCMIAGSCSKPNSFIFSCLLFCLTFILIAKFKSFRASFMLPNRVRVIVGNFALPLTIIIVTVFAHCVGIEVPQLSFSPLRTDGSFATTNGLRSLIVNPGVVPAWGVFTAILVAIPCSLLVVMDQHFAAIVVNRRENRLRHGCGYHLDLLAIIGTLLVSAIFGLPIYAGVVLLSYANVVSLQHTPSMAKESKQGYSPLSFRIREQRVSSIFVAILLGFCVLLRGVFSLIPVAILYGVFFYIGLAMLTGTQFWHRTKLFLVPPKYQPDYKFLRFIELIKVHVFTTLQVGLFLLLWVVIVIKPIAYFFPLMLILIAFVRHLLTFGFAHDELLRLDAVLVPLRMLMRPGEIGANTSFPASEAPSTVGGSSFQEGGKKFVANVRAGLAKRLESAREAIRKRMPSPSRASQSGPSDVEEETPGEESTLRSDGSPQKPARRQNRQEAVDYSDGMDEVQTASVGSPSSVYASATAITNTSPNKVRGRGYEASPPAKEESARLLGKRSEGVRTQVEVADEEYDADEDTTLAQSSPDK